MCKLQTQIGVWYLDIFSFQGNIALKWMPESLAEEVQVIEILPCGKQWPTYLTWSISLLLMAWWHKEPGHQQPWYWTSFPGIFQSQHPTGKLVLFWVLLVLVTTHLMTYKQQAFTWGNPKPLSATVMVIINSLLLISWSTSTLVQVMACCLMAPSYYLTTNALSSSLSINQSINQSIN